MPFLAESVEPNDDYTQWTIKLREGITFHNGTPLNADAVKLNFDAFREGSPVRRSSRSCSRRSRASTSSTT